MNIVYSQQCVYSKSVHSMQYSLFVELATTINTRVIAAMLPALLLAVFLPLPKMAAADGLLTSPLFEYPLGGDPFDDGTTSVIPPVAHLHSVLVCHGDWIDSIQLVYILQNNGTFIASPHGKINDNCGEDSNMTKIVFKEDKRLVRVEGVVNAGVKYVSQLKLFTSISWQLPVFKGRPFGVTLIHHSH